MFASSEADLAYVADGVLLGVDLGADSSPATAGLDDGVGRRGRNLIIVSTDQFVHLVLNQTAEIVFVRGGTEEKFCNTVLVFILGSGVLTKFTTVFIVINHLDFFRFLLPDYEDDFCSLSSVILKYQRALLVFHRFHDRLTLKKPNYESI
uniref:Uncharacterized protein n=1 Tax=Acanthochromis polyacanthus TaxID=80966 RepID=A0A3Q1GC23_9TELE